MSDGFPGGGNGRRRFLEALGKSSLGAMIGSALTGKMEAVELEEGEAVWKAASKRRLRIGVAGFGERSRVGALGLQDHPNVKVAAVADRNADRREALRCEMRCANWYDSLELMVKDRR